MGSLATAELKERSHYVDENTGSGQKPPRINTWDGAQHLTGAWDGAVRGGRAKIKLLEK